MAARRLLALSADNEPLWVRLYVDEIGIAPDVADLRGMLSANRCQCHGMVYEIQRFRLGTRQVPRS
jgi:hypothetical protein